MPFRVAAVAQESVTDEKEFVTALLREIDKVDADYRANVAKYTPDTDAVKAIAKVVGATPAEFRWASAWQSARD